jgi:predicted SAM-dependent methyltransferase
MRKFLRRVPFVYENLLIIKHRLWSVNTTKSLGIYLSNQKSPKLQLGAGSNNLEGWFNTDYFPRNNIFFVDVTKPFQVPSDSFDFVLSEHHIEHIPYRSAVEMLKEAFRIMKPGGLIRISTPDLRKYINAYEQDTTMKTEVAAHAEDWIYSGFHNAVNYVPIDDYFTAHFVNDIFLNYEHRFIFDFESLGRILENAGFINIKNCSLKESVHPEFKDVETHNSKFDRYFTLSVEAQKPQT